MTSSLAAPKSRRQRLTCRPEARRDVYVRPAAGPQGHGRAATGLMLVRARSRKALKAPGDYKHSLEVKTDSDPYEQCNVM